MVFEDLLLSASWQKDTIDGVEIVAGDVVTSVATLQDNTGLSKPTVIKALRILEDTGEITRRRVEKTTIIHITNFCFYQVKNFDRGKKILPDTGKNILPTSVKSFNPSGKIILPTLEDKKNIEEIYLQNARARTPAREELVKNALVDLAIEQGCMSLGVGADEYRELAKAVINDWEFADLPDRDWSLDHLLRTMRIKLNIKKRNGNNQSTGRTGDTSSAELAREYAEQMAALVAEGKRPNQVTF